jgi:hypothetical protein
LFCACVVDAMIKQMKKDILRNIVMGFTNG